MGYQASNWYWQGQPAGQSSPIIYSSASGSVVAGDNAAYVAWLAAGNEPTPWPEDETGVITVTALDAELVRVGLPPTGLATLTKAQLLAYADSKVWTLLAIARPYTVDGLSGPVVDDCGGETAITMNTAWAQLANLAYPFTWSDDNYAVWSMSQAQLTAFLGAAFAYAASLWAVMNGTAIPGIASGSLATTSAIDALAWPT